MVNTIERHDGEAPLKNDLFLGYTDGLFSLHKQGGFFSLAICISSKNKWQEARETKGSILQ